MVALSGRLDRVLADQLDGYSRARLSSLVREGAVTVDGLVVDRPSRRVHVGARVVVNVPAPRPAEAVAQDLPLTIVHEDSDVVVVNKAAGMVVHPGPGHPDGTLVNALLHHVRDLSGIGGVERPGLVHRLDRGTSGLLVVAKHDGAHRHLAAQFADHTAGRTYLAIGVGEPPAMRGTRETMVARHPNHRLRWASTVRAGKRACTHWAVRDRAGTICLIECRLETGRTHQVRVHLTELGLPILGDPLYKRRGGSVPGAVASLVPPERPMLHAWRLRFGHPRSGDAMAFCAVPPADMVTVATAAGLEFPGDELL